MPTPAEQIKERINIADVVSGYLKLDKAGVNLKGRCPFHNEKTASFFVSPSRQSFHCFGCNKGGDVISFVQEIEGVDFIGALKLLADRAGIQLELQSGPKRAEDRDRAEILRALEAAAAFYERSLKEHPEAVKYLADRGIANKTVGDFRLGFAPPGWRNLSEHLQAAGFSPLVLEKAGLSVQKEGGGSVYDRFRGRLMFPLADAGGTVVGFSGRLFDPENGRVEEAKYLNSPQTAVYDKSRVLYGFDRAKLAIRREDKAILVEGQMDLVLAHQAGLENTVAVSGTALTDKHLSALKRLSSNLVMAFDGDPAGIAAARRGVELALSLGLDVKMAALPEGSDPADIAKSDPKELVRIVAEAQHVVDFYLAVLVRRYEDRRERAHAIRRELYGFVRKLPQRIDRAHFIKKIAEVTGLSEDIIWQDVNESTAQSEHSPSHSLPSVLPGVLRPVTREERILRHLFGILWWLGESRNLPIEEHELYRQLEELVGTVTVKTRLERLSPVKGEILLELEIAYGAEAEPLEAVGRELYETFRQEFLKSELMKATEKLKEAEAIGDVTAVDKCLKKCQDISNLINNKG